MKNKKFNDEMVNVVKSTQSKDSIEEWLKEIEPKAFTSEGVIQSYEIDYESIEHNPMGGIMFNVIINNDKELKVYNLLEKDLSTGNLSNIGGGYSSKLDELLTDGGN